LSRDTYFIFILYKQMYPELKLDQDYNYVYSSRICYIKNSDSHYEYLKTFTKKKENLLFIDVFGSGITFLNIYKKKEIDKISTFLNMDTYLFGYTGTKNIQHGITIKIFLEHLTKK